jgi:inositol hexakisphosphate/diphosphoinositol-pentakisphosphate kinase
VLLVLPDASNAAIIGHPLVSLQYYDDAAGILRMVILSAIQPHRLLAAPQPLPQHPCGDMGSEAMEGSQHGMHYNMSMDDMRSQAAGEEDK